MNSVADLGGIFYRSRFNCSCFCTSYKCETGRTLGDGLDGDQFEAMGLAGFVYFRSCFENNHTRRTRDTV